MTSASFDWQATYAADARVADMKSSCLTMFSWFKQAKRGVGPAQARSVQGVGARPAATSHPSPSVVPQSDAAVRKATAEPTPSVPDEPSTPIATSESAVDDDMDIYEPEVCASPPAEQPESRTEVEDVDMEEGEVDPSSPRPMPPVAESTPDASLATKLSPAPTNTSPPAHSTSPLPNVPLAPPVAKATALPTKPSDSQPDTSLPAPASPSLAKATSPSPAKALSPLPTEVAAAQPKVSSPPAAEAASPAPARASSTPAKAASSPAKVPSSPAKLLTPPSSKVLPPAETASPPLAAVAVNPDVSDERAEVDEPMDESVEEVTFAAAVDNSGTAPKPSRKRPPVSEAVVVDISDDDESDEDSCPSSPDDSDEVEAKLCLVCNIDENDDESLLCDECGNVYHTYCVGLHAVPSGDWFCPSCARVYSTQSSLKAPELMVKDLKRMDKWLVHSCQCDAAACDDEAFGTYCAHLKKALKVMSWLSFNPEVRAVGFADKMAKLFAFHAIHCQVGPACPVPLCRKVHASDSSA
ncbi:hypothetical protein ACHHYP_04446 [Achlya hypogyna]|uniref:PHD-type domain-containing protein n=1 Tax=Achlya hypogyna TaxID=1202772 RepID=A0A1V9Z180_ACHHY|nr:hypothetical protein ACHHYP_04446 [Achlya hypogyna]